MSILTDENVFLKKNKKTGVALLQATPAFDTLFILHIHEQVQRLLPRLDTAKMAELADRALKECDTMEEVVELVHEYVK